MDFAFCERHSNNSMSNILVHLWSDFVDTHALLSRAYQRFSFKKRKGRISAPEKEHSAVSACCSTYHPMSELPSVHHHSLGLDDDQTEQLIALSDESVRKLRDLHLSKIMSDANHAATWNQFYDQDGVQVAELVDSAASGGILTASCSVSAAPDVIKKLLIEKPNVVDGLLIGKSVLTTLDSNKSVQWLGYGAIWPIGARDFLLLTTEVNYNDDNESDGFIIVSSSIDNICEEEEENENEEYQFTRSQIRLAGYMGTKNSAGGTDIHLFVDIDLYAFVPSWLVHQLAQYGLGEKMTRIKKYCDPTQHAQVSSVYEFTKYINLPTSVLSVFGKVEDSPESPKVADTSVPVASTSNKGRGRRASIMTRRASTVQQNKMYNSRASITEAAMITRRNSVLNAQAIAEITVSENPTIAKGLKIAADSRVILKTYIGITNEPNEYNLNWVEKNNGKGVTVSTSVVNGSTWQAIRAETVITSTKEKIKDLLLDDTKFGAYDDMFDFCQFIIRIDERTVIRRVAFKAIWPTSPRDFIVLTTWTDLPDGSILVSSKSAGNDVGAEEKGFVRGNILCSGYHIRPYTDGTSDIKPGQCKVTLSAHSDLGGSLPSSIINMLATAAPIKIMSSINDIVTKK